MGLTDEQRQKLKQAVLYWAEHHPHPNGVAFQLASGAEYTPMQIAEAVDKESDLGKLEFRVVEHALDQGHKFEEILEGYYKKQSTHLREKE